MSQNWYTHEYKILYFKSNLAKKIQKRKIKFFPYYFSSQYSNKVVKKTDLTTTQQKLLKDDVILECALDTKRKIWIPERERDDKTDIYLKTKKGLPQIIHKKFHQDFHLLNLRLVIIFLTFFYLSQYTVNTKIRSLFGSISDFLLFYFLLDLFFHSVQKKFLKLR